MSTEIRVREEDGAMIFEKDKMNDLEMKFYNPEYFAMIGFSDAEIKMINKTDGSEVGDGASEQPPPDSMDAENGSMEQPPPDSMAAENGSVEQPPDSMAAENGSEEPPPDSMATENGSMEQPPDSMAVENGSGEQQESGDQVKNEMKGGYYKNVRILTVPFRHFVYFVQGRGKEPDQTTTESDKSQTFFTGFSSIFDKIRGTFGISESNASVDKDKQASPDGVSSDGTQVDSTATPSNADIMWVVKIPIIKEELGIHENEERELNQIIIEHRAEKTNNIIVTGERYLIGSRSIKMANTVEEGISTVQFPESNLVGTKMHKYAKLNNSGTSNKSGLFGVFY